MKYLIIIVAACVLCAWFPFIGKPDYKSVFLSYNVKDHTLLIPNGSSGAYISKIELDLHRDTLSVKVYKRMIFIKPNSIINSSVTRWKINLKPNTGFVRFGDTLKPLSELRAYSIETESVRPKPPIIEVFPHKYPSIVK
jgi:hypothetical protein